MIGQIISHYRNLEKLSGRSKGIIYKAGRTSLHRFAALQFLLDILTQNFQALDRFQRKAHAAAGISHPNLFVALDIGQH